MKVGMRKQSLKKSIGARTTGKAKRSMKRAVNPMYGKKGMGWINDPKKAAYNHVYNKTSKSVKDVFSPEASEALEALEALGASSASDNNTESVVKNKSNIGFLDAIIILCQGIYYLFALIGSILFLLLLLAIFIACIYIIFKVIF